MRQESVLLLTSFIVCGLSLTSAANWAVLVAGSSGWYNYRHQSDICHAYQILHRNGIPDSNIIVMMYDDIAQNPENPTKGIIINHPNGSDVYAGVPHDYTGKDVTPKNFMNILLGNKQAMSGIGSEKVLGSGPDDNVFIYFADHGSVGLIAFPTGVLHAKDFNQTIATMYAQNKYKEMVIYIEACESGSMFEGILPSNINVYATTASNAKESSYACYYDQLRETYLGDHYSVAWMEDSDGQDITQETLHQQYLIVKKMTNSSHVMEYGDQNMGRNDYVSQFQAADKQSDSSQTNSFQKHYNQLLPNDAVPTVDVRLAIVARRLAALNGENSAKKDRLESELHQLIQDRALITKKIQQIASVAVLQSNPNQYQSVLKEIMTLTQHDCHKTVTERIHEKCFDLQNEYVLNQLYIMANLCEIGLSESIISRSIDAVCKQRLDFKY